MRQYFFLLVLLIIVHANAQEKKSIEFVIYSRYDKHADYTTRFFDRSYTDDTKLYGSSYGLGLNYVQPLNRHIKLTAGLGYYRAGIDKVSQVTRFTPNAKARNIDYRPPDNTLVLLSTDKYHYTNFTVTAGCMYEPMSSKKVNFVTGADLTYLYTFSQVYHIAYKDTRFRTHNRKTLGWGVNTFAGVLIKMKDPKYYMSPRIILPVCQLLTGDKVFGEDKNIQMRKWFNGIGLSISVGKYF